MPKKVQAKKAAPKKAPPPAKKPAPAAAKKVAPVARKTAVKAEPQTKAKKPAAKAAPAKPAVKLAPPPAKKPAAPSAASAKPAKAAKAADAKAVAAKPAEARSPAAKPAETKPSTAKPAAAKAPAPKPAATQPAAVRTEAPKPTPPVAAPAAHQPARPFGKPELVRKSEPPKSAQAIKAEFKPLDFVVYPTHGVGKILRIEKTEISGTHLELFVIEFEKDKMMLRVPLTKVHSVGMRRLSSPQKMKTALLTLKGRARVKRAMWSRRAQEYEAKINSGDPVAIAEVVRDLHRNAGQPDQSYSERQIYEAARDRLVRELAAVEEIDEQAATERLEKVLRAA